MWSYLRVDRNSRIVLEPEDQLDPVPDVVGGPGLAGQPRHAPLHGCHQPLLCWNDRQSERQMYTVRTKDLIRFYACNGRLSKIAAI